MPPSGAPTSPSALSGPCHTSFHLRPPAMTPGISVVITSLAGVGCRNSCPPPPPALCCCGCCAMATPLTATADPTNKQAIAHIDFNFIWALQVAWPQAGKSERSFNSGAAVYTGTVLKGRVQMQRGGRSSNFKEGEPGEFNEEISGKEDRAEDKSQNPEVFAFDVAATVVDGRGSGAIGSKNAHEAERVAEQQSPGQARHPRNRHCDDEEDLK